MAVRRGVDDGYDVDVQGKDSTHLDICTGVDDLLYGADILERNVDTSRGLRLLWRCAETYAVADILQKSDNIADGFRYMVSLPPPTHT